jgi:hypothetical protein
MKDIITIAEEILASRTKVVEESQIKEWRKGIEAAKNAVEHDHHFLAMRLRRVANLVGYKMPEGDDAFVFGVAGTILGDIARKIEELISPVRDVAPIPTAERLPTEEDADPFSKVLAASKKEKTWGVWNYMTLRMRPDDFVCWLPTGLKQPPAPGESE